MSLSLILAQMLTEPGHCRGARGSELPRVRIEMSAVDRDELLRLECLLVGAQLEIGQGDVVGQRDDHQQRRGGNPGDPSSRLVIRARRAERTVTSFSQAPGGSGWR